MLDLVSDWEPLPSIASIDAASSFGKSRHLNKVKNTKSTVQPFEKRDLPPERAPPLLVSDLKTDREPADPALACVSPRDKALSQHLVPNWLKPLLLEKHNLDDEQIPHISEAPVLKAEPKTEPDVRDTAKTSTEVELQTQTVPHGASLQQRKATPRGQPSQTSSKLKPSSSLQINGNQLRCDRCPSNPLPERQDDRSNEHQPGAHFRSDLEAKAYHGQQPEVDIKSEPAESSQEEGQLSEQEEGQISGEHDSLEVPAEAPAKRKRGERAGKRVRQRIAKRAREREERQLGLETNPHQQQQLQIPAKIPKRDRPTCKYFLFGKCSKGVTCPFPHVGLPVTKLISCRFFHQGTCQKGDACPYSHDNTQEPCKQLVVHGVCRFGPSCHFSHNQLPAYAVAPLQDWFKEQDQLKLDRSARLAGEAEGSPTLHHLQAADAPQLNSPSECPPDAGLGQLGEEQPSIVGHSSRQSSPSGGVPRYSSWKEPWERLCAPSIQAKQQAKEQQGLTGDVDCRPLSGPYASWQDGWNKLFAQNEVKSE